MWDPDMALLWSSMLLNLHHHFPRISKIYLFKFTGRTFNKIWSDNPTWDNINDNQRWITGNSWSIIFVHVWFMFHNPKPLSLFLSGLERSIGISWFHLAYDLHIIRLRWHCFVRTWCWDRYHSTLWIHLVAVQYWLLFCIVVWDITQCRYL